ncbi:hypothetical protein [Polymorphobacter multimanifer]|uniref:hypothetical protein n=1 Tax=Polymorphobacter multimanifer TaxID=1070431 RepID=UPI001A9C292F|nr:hypothetical protein [Polymorphobacter multimanifer]
MVAALQKGAWPLGHAPLVLLAIPIASVATIVATLLSLLLTHDPVLLALHLVALPLDLVAAPLDTIGLPLDTRALAIDLHLLAIELTLLPDLSLRHTLPGDGTADTVADHRPLRDDTRLPIGTLLLVPRTARSTAIVNEIAVARIIITIVPAKALANIADRDIAVSIRITPILIIVGIATGVAIPWRASISILIGTCTDAHGCNRQQSKSKNTSTQHGNLQSVVGNRMIRLNEG